jgi:hypothetical protein
MNQNRRDKIKVSSLLYLIFGVTRIDSSYTIEVMHPFTTKMDHNQNDVNEVHVY